MHTMSNLDGYLFLSGFLGEDFFDDRYGGHIIRTEDGLALTT